MTLLWTSIWFLPFLDQGLKIVFPDQTALVVIGNYLNMYFLGLVLRIQTWIADNQQHHSQRLPRPGFVPRVITDEVQTLQIFILDNLLDVAAKCFVPNSDFKDRWQIASCIRKFIGHPDHLMTRNGNIVALIVKKGEMEFT